MNKSEFALRQLRSDVARWLGVFETAGATHQHGIGARASTAFEELLRTAAEAWIVKAGEDLTALLTEVGFDRPRTPITRLTLGPLVKALAALRQRNGRFAGAFPREFEFAIRDVVAVRNRISHERLQSPSKEVEQLLRKVSAALSFDPFWSVLAA